MNYQAMYRRWRPSRFTEMVGQEHIRRTLQNALKNERVNHAYLFCGPRGTGKTTTAKILAKALNCAEGPAAEPCNQCAQCRNISEGRTMDVLEIDAASNRGIDEIRDLREKVRYNPSESRHKVYIIDEVHMLTNEAFNALLKTLEEPPRQVIFILATTEPHKVPSTIVSRCQRFDFRLLAVKEIANRLKDAAAQEGWEADEQALVLLARLAGGSMRDAFGLCEQCRAYRDGVVMLEGVQELFGVTAPELISELTASIAQNKPREALRVVNDVVFSGKDLVLFVRDFVLFLSRLLLLESGAGTAETARDLPGFEEYLEQNRRRFSYDALLEMTDQLNGLLSELRRSHYPHFLLEMAVLRLLRVNALIGKSSWDSVMDKIAVLEEKITRNNTASKKPDNRENDYQADNREQSVANRNYEQALVESAAALASTESTGKREEALPKEAQHDQANVEAVGDQTGKSSILRVKKEWPRLLQQIKKLRAQAHAWLEFGEPEKIENGVLFIAFPRQNELHKRNTEKEENRVVIEKALQGIWGEDMKIKCLFREGEKEPDSMHKDEAGGREKKPGTVEGEPLFESARQIFKGQIIEAEDRR